VKKHAKPVKLPPLIYNLFPRYFPSIDQWSTVVGHAAEMGFNWIYVNPFHETGFSGSQYAIRDYYRINKLFLGSGVDPADWRMLVNFIDACAEKGQTVMMDLVINHTAFDSTLVESHPLWYKRDGQGSLVHPRAIDPANADNITIWGDLAEIDNKDGKDREGLWAYWDKLIGFFQNLGVLGFRCDAAYQVSAELWKFLISSAKKRDARTIFIAETLGCRLEEIDALAGTGFDYLYNSSKYWEFDRPWCVEQHERNKRIAPSISFPESHDTARLASEFPGTMPVQKNRYLMSALFSEGLLMTMGFEYGAKIKMDVVRGGVGDVERPQWDLTKWIAGVNLLKIRTPVLREEGTWNVLSPYEGDILFLEKRLKKAADSIVLCVNKNKLNCRTVSLEELPPNAGPMGILRPFSEISLDLSAATRVSVPFELGPAEIVLFFYPARPDRKR
jgi:starch synthase (maltosyl-transferring)